MSPEELYKNVFMDLLTIYPTACKRKWKSTETHEFNANYFYNLEKIAHAIVGKYYNPKPGYRFPIVKPTPREIFASVFQDRVVHHLFYHYVNPIVEPLLIKNSFACRKNKGVLKGIQALYSDIWSASEQGKKTVYVLKCDISAYFMHINRTLVRDIMRRILLKHRYKGKDTKKVYQRDIALFLLDKFALRDPLIDSERRGSESDWKRVPLKKKLEGAPTGCGLPIGDLTSQLFSNVYLNEFDQWVKRVKKRRYYGRYVDDFYVVANDQRELEVLLTEMSEWLQQNLMLTLNPKKCHIYKVSDKGEGVHFLGARIYLHRIFASRRTIKGYLKADDPISINSYLGTLRHFATRAFRRRTLPKKGFSIGDTFMKRNDYAK